MKTFFRDRFTISLRFKNLSPVARVFTVAALLFPVTVLFLNATTTSYVIPPGITALNPPIPLGRGLLITGETKDDAGNLMYVIQPEEGGAPLSLVNPTNSVGQGLGFLDLVFTNPSMMKKLGVNLLAGNTALEVPANASGWNYYIENVYNPSLPAASQAVMRFYNFTGNLPGDFEVFEFPADFPGEDSKAHVGVLTYLTNIVKNGAISIPDLTVFPDEGGSWLHDVGDHIIHVLTMTPAVLSAVQAKDAFLLGAYADVNGTQASIFRKMVVTAMKNEVVIFDRSFYIAENFCWNGTDSRPLTIWTNLILPSPETTDLLNYVKNFVADTPNYIGTTQAMINSIKSLQSTYLGSATLSGPLPSATTAALQARATAMADLIQGKPATLLPAFDPFALTQPLVYVTPIGAPAAGSLPSWMGSNGVVEATVTLQNGGTMRVELVPYQPTDTTVQNFEILNEALAIMSPQGLTTPFIGYSVNVNGKTYGVYANPEGSFSLTQTPGGTALTPNGPALIPVVGETMAVEGLLEADQIAIDAGFKGIGSALVTNTGATAVVPYDPSVGQGNAIPEGDLVNTFENHVYSVPVGEPQMVDADFGEFFTSTNATGPQGTTLLNQLGEGVDVGLNGLNAGLFALQFSQNPGAAGLGFGANGALELAINAGQAWGGTVGAVSGKVGSVLPYAGLAVLGASYALQASEELNNPYSGINPQVGNMTTAFRQAVQNVLANQMASNTNLSTWLDLAMNQSQYITPSLLDSVALSLTSSSQAANNFYNDTTGSLINPWALAYNPSVATFVQNVSSAAINQSALVSNTLNDPNLSNIYNANPSLYASLSINAPITQSIWSQMLQTGLMPDASAMNKFMGFEQSLLMQGFTTAQILTVPAVTQFIEAVTTGGFLQSAGAFMATSPDNYTPLNGSIAPPVSFDMSTVTSLTQLNSHLYIAGADYGNIYDAIYSAGFMPANNSAFVVGATNDGSQYFVIKQTSTGETSIVVEPAGNATSADSFALQYAVGNNLTVATQTGTLVSPTGDLSHIAFSLTSSCTDAPGVCLPPSTTATAMPQLPDLVVTAASGAAPQPAVVSDTLPTNQGVTIDPTTGAVSFQVTSTPTTPQALANQSGVPVAEGSTFNLPGGDSDYVPGFSAANGNYLSNISGVTGSSIDTGFITNFTTDLAISDPSQFTALNENYFSVSSLSDSNQVISNVNTDNISIGGNTVDYVFPAPSFSDNLGADVSGALGTFGNVGGPAAPSRKGNPPPWKQNYDPDRRLMGFAILMAGPIPSFIQNQIKNMSAAQIMANADNFLYYYNLAPAFAPGVANVNPWIYPISPGQVLAYRLANKQFFTGCKDFGTNGYTYEIPNDTRPTCPADLLSEYTNGHYTTPSATGGGGLNHIGLMQETSAVYCAAWHAYNPSLGTPPICQTPNRVGRPVSEPTPPQNRTCGFPAYGSSDESYFTVEQMC